MKKLQVLLLTTAVLMLSGCVISIDGNHEDSDSWESTQRANDRAIRRLELGRSMNSVQAEMGEADFVEAFNRNGEEYMVLYYRTHRVDSDGRTSKDETTPLVFIGGLLVGWGDAAIENATSN